MKKFTISNNDLIEGINIKDYTNGLGFSKPSNLK